MKKFFSVLMAAILLILPVSLSSCSGGWQEVQSITYTTDTESKTLTSTYEWSYEGDMAGRDEFINAPSDEIFPYALHGNIDSEKGNLPENPSKFFGNSYYAQFTSDPFGVAPFWFVTITDYEEHYVKVKLLSDGSIDLKYYENNTIITKHILPISYVITYFND